MNTEFPTRWCGMAQSWMQGNVAPQHLLLVLVMYWVNSGWTNSSLAVGLSVFFCSRHLKRMSRIDHGLMEGLAKCQFTKQQKYSSICRNHFIHRKTQIEKEQYCGFDNVSLSVEYMTVHFCVFISASEKYCLLGYFHFVKFSPVYTCNMFRPVLNSLWQVIFK